MQPLKELRIRLIYFKRIRKPFAFLLNMSYNRITKMKVL